jgi:hypothetical protein
MKTTVLGVVLVAAVSALTIAGFGQPGEAWAEPESAVEGSSQLIAVSAMVGERVQQVTVIDSRQRVMSVYHIELATGAVTLKSVRNITWDLQLREFNGVNPLPREIRALLENK